MDRKLSWEDAERYGHLEGNESIYAKPNKYGYKINVNHPDVKPYYDHYKRTLGAKILSDSERKRFEDAFFKMLEKKGREEPCLQKSNQTAGRAAKV